MVETVFLINSLILGLAATFSPCLLPLIPSFIAFVTDKNKNLVVSTISALLVMLGIMTVFVTLGIVISSSNIRFFLASNYLLFRTLQGALLIVLGILMLIAYTPNSGILYKMNSFADSVIQRIDNPYLFAYVIGLFFTLLAAPCAILIFGTVITYTATEPISGAILIMVLFSVGAGIPFLIIAILVPSARDSILDRYTSIHKYLSVTAGLIILILGSLLVLDGQRIIEFNG